ncbi:hypothetical protein ACVGWB_00105, partial [Enterobacter mori]
RGIGDHQKTFIARKLGISVLLLADFLQVGKLVSNQISQYGRGACCLWWGIGQLLLGGVLVVLGLKRRVAEVRE